MCTYTFTLPYFYCYTLCMKNRNIEVRRNGEDKEVLIYVEYRFKCVDYVRVCVHLFVTSISLWNKRVKKIIHKCKQSISQGMALQYLRIICK